MPPNPDRYWQRAMLRMVVTTLALLLAPALASAQPERFEALLAEGIELRVQGRPAEALARFRSAVELEPQSLRARGHLALALHAVGAWIESETLMLSVLAAPDDDWVERHRAELQGSLRAVQQHLGWLEVEVPGSGLAWLDGVAIGAVPSGKPMRVVATRCVVRVQIAGRPPMSKEVEIVPGQHTRVVFAGAQGTSHTVSVRAPHQAAERRVPPTPNPWREPADLRAYGLLSLGGGAAALVTGGWLGIRALVLKRERDDECDGRVCSAEGIRLDARGRMAASLSGLMLGVGAAGLVAGGVLIWADSRDSSSVSLLVSPGASCGDARLLVGW